MNAAPQLSSAYQDEIPNYRLSEDSVSSLNLRSSQVRIMHPRSDWIKDLEARFDELTSLPRGWDGYAGEPVSFACAQFAANLIERLYIHSVPAPQLVPGSDRTLQLEWHLNHFDLEIDVLGPYDVVATRFDRLTGHEEEMEVQTDFTELASWVVALGERRDLQQEEG